MTRNQVYAAIVREAFKGADHKFSCVMAYIPKEVAQQVLQWGQQNIPKEDQHFDDKEEIYGLEEEPHVTVKYGLHDPTPAATQELLDCEPPVKMKLGKISLAPDTTGT